MALARQPGLVLEHADAYVDLASAELDEWGAQWKHRAGLNSAAALLAVLVAVAPRYGTQVLTPVGRTSAGFFRGSFCHEGWSRSI